MVEGGEEEKIQVTMSLYKSFYSQGGTVFIYKVTPPENALLEEFYIATFDNLHSEEAWGLGATPRSALEAAAHEWDGATPEEINSNPFRQILEEQFSQ